MIDPLTPEQFFEYVVYAGLALLLAVFVPVKLTAKFRRRRRARICLTCRICGYRFLKSDPYAICPHCQARNRG